MNHLDRPEYLDVFNELGNIGAGNATTALSQILNRPVAMAVPYAKFVPFGEITRILGGPAAVVVSGLIEISGDLDGFVLLVLSDDNANKIVKALVEDEDIPESVLDYSEMQFSAITEVTNILIGAYVTAIGSLTGLTIMLSPPHIAVDMAGAVMSVPAIEYGKLGDTVLFIETEFDDTLNSLAGHFFLVPDVKSTSKMLSSLGMA